MGAYVAVNAAKDSSVSHSIIEHWNGKQWSLSAGAGKTGNLDGITALQNGHAWAVGSVATAGGADTLIEYWNGSRWFLSPGVNPAKPENVLEGVAAAGPHVWAVGWDGHPAGTNRTHTLAEEYTTC